MALQTVEVKKGQCSIDLAIQHTGGLSGLFEIARLNDLKLIADTKPGLSIVVDKKSNNMTNYLDKKNIVIAASDDPELFVGIDYMEIGNDFIIS